MQPGNYGLVIFERQQEDPAPPYLHIHIVSPKFVSNVNQANYAALLGFTQGNLTEVSSYKSAQPKDQGAKPQRTTFNPAFKFGPPAADFPNMRVTAVVKEATVRPSSPCDIAAAQANLQPHCISPPVLWMRLLYCVSSPIWTCHLKLSQTRTCVSACGFGTTFEQDLHDVTFGCWKVACHMLQMREGSIASLRQQAVQQAANGQVMYC